MSRVEAAEGESFIKDFDVVKTLGKGSFATAYLAKDSNLNVLRVIKVLNASLMTSKEDNYVSLFQQEAQALALINDENVARILTCGTTMDGRPFFVMEHLPGKDLRAVIKDQKGKRIAPLDVVKLGIQIFEGLSAAHDVQIVHRDIKPENIFIVPQGGGRDGRHPGHSLKAKIIDFGTFSVSGTTEVRGDTVVYRGTPRYSAPEMFDGLPATPECDIYSVGILLYELLTGSTPFGHIKADDFDALAEAHATETPRPILEQRHDVPEALVRLIDSLLAKDPNVRPRSAEWVAHKLRDLNAEFDRTATETHAVTARTIELRGGQAAPATLATQRLSSPRFVENETDVDGVLIEDMLRELAERGVLGPAPEPLSAEDAARYDFDTWEIEPRVVSARSVEVTRTASSVRATKKLSLSEVPLHGTVVNPLPAERPAATPEVSRRPLRSSEDPSTAAPERADHPRTHGHGHVDHPAAPANSPPHVVKREAANFIPLSSKWKHLLRESLPVITFLCIIAMGLVGAVMILDNAPHPVRGPSPLTAPHPPTATSLASPATGNPRIALTDTGEKRRQGVSSGASLPRHGLG